MASGGGHGSRSPSPAERRPPPFPEHRGPGAPDSDSEGEDIFTGSVSAAAGGAPPRGRCGAGPVYEGLPGTSSRLGENSAKHPQIPQNKGAGGRSLWSRVPSGGTS